MHVSSETRTGGVTVLLEPLRFPRRVQRYDSAGPAFKPGVLISDAKELILQHLS